MIINYDSLIVFEGLLNGLIVFGERENAEQNDPERYSDFKKIEEIFKNIDIIIANDVNVEV
jgi:hypothetical protein